MADKSRRLMPSGVCHSVILGSFSPRSTFKLGATLIRVSQSSMNDNDRFQNCQFRGESEERGKAKKLQF